MNKTAKIIKILEKSYPKAETALIHKNPFQLLCAVILSAQCTDERVNKVAPVLFAKYPAAEKLARAPAEEVEKIIRSTGFYKNKAKSLIACARAISEKYGGIVPDTMDELLTLRGVARKTANVVLSSAYGKAEGIVVDTHVLRLSARLDLSAGKNAVSVEKDLMKIIPRDKWIWFSFALISHGRAVCKARSPRCSVCALSKLCPSADLSGNK